MDRLTFHIYYGGYSRYFSWREMEGIFTYPPYNYEWRIGNVHLESLRILCGNCWRWLLNFTVC
jgi:hypothetical protein